MRVIVLFDLPVTTLEGKRAYREFRKFLIKKGFIMMQESVYCKLALNATIAGNVMKAVRDNCPDKGLVQMLTVTEKQYARIEYVVGGNNSMIIDSDKRLIVL